MNINSPIPDNPPENIPDPNWEEVKTVLSNSLKYSKDTFQINCFECLDDILNTVKAWFPPNKKRLFDDIQSFNSQERVPTAMNRLFNNIRDGIPKLDTIFQDKHDDRYAHYKQQAISTWCSDLRVNVFDKLYRNL